ncbi:unnamed protein product [Nyctereutes procyonoides]|uniref:Guanine nucleotide-binding protein subunit gamma n=1 Tax=Nyctereutes procyonoides TaxID=34880 RepID=A0A811YRV0_NYCPR|nr:unnamed protein product [Nyctereutes procyonoides]
MNTVLLISGKRCPAKIARTNKHSSGKENCARVKTATFHKRTKVSTASLNSCSYCEEHAISAPLLIGIPTSENLLRDKKICIIFLWHSETVLPLVPTK